MTKPRSYVHILKSFQSDRIVIRLFAFEDGSVILWSHAREHHMVLTNTDKAPLTCAHSHPVVFYDVTHTNLTRNYLKSLWIHNLP